MARNDVHLISVIFNFVTTTNTSYLIPVGRLFIPANIAGKTGFRRTLGCIDAECIGWEIGWMKKVWLYTTYLSLFYIYIGLLIIFLHTYCNIWVKAGDAWTIFIARRTAAVKLSFLANATKEELEEREEPCPICLDSMVEAKVTQCRHLFHSNCLRKWLYIRASCPLCHQDVLVNKVKEDWQLLQNLRRLASVGWWEGFERS